MPFAPRNPVPPRPRGFTMLETLAFISLSVIVLVGGLSLYDWANRKARVIEVTRLATTLVDRVRKYCGAQAPANYCAGDPAIFKDLPPGWSPGTRWGGTKYEKYYIHNEFWNVMVTDNSTPITGVGSQIKVEIQHTFPSCDNSCQMLLRELGATEIEGTSATDNLGVGHRWMLPK